MTFQGSGFRRSSTASSGESKPPATPPFKGRFGNSSASGLGVSRFSSLSSDVSSSNIPPNHDIPDFPVVQDVTSGLVNENDIVIAIMGLTRAGKSSFVNQVSGNTDVLVGHDLKSRTRKVQPVRCVHPDGRRNIVLVDTPGFDDTQLSDARILGTIAHWLRETYKGNIKLAGILYLHRISDDRMAGTPLRNLKVFKDLCGKDNMRNIILVTTMWDQVEDTNIGHEREKELVSSFWKDMIRYGSHTRRYEGTLESAWGIVNDLKLEESFRRRAPPQIQQEMVDRDLPLHETAAAKTLFSSLREEFRKVWAKIRGKVNRKSGSGQSPGGLIRQVLRDASIRSSSSRGSSSTDSRTYTSNIASRDSTCLSSPADSTTSGCSVAGRREALSAMVEGLRIIHEEAEIVPVPTLRGAIEIVLCIATLIKEINGSHHALSQVVENSGWLLEEIARYAMKSKLSKDMEIALNSFQRELKHIQNIVQKFKNNGPTTRFLLQDDDIQAIMVCNTSITIIHEKLGLMLTMDAIVNLQEEMKVLRINTELRKCQCGSWAIREENEEAFEIASQTGASVIF